MIQWAIELYKEHTFWMATLGYALPVLINAFIFSQRSIAEYFKDISERSKQAKNQNDYYVPTLTIGSLVLRFLGVVLPIVNACVMIRNSHRILAYISYVFEWIGDVMNTPLVPKNRK
jgi:hypothetical protein